MLFVAECIRIFTTWQAIPFKRKFYLGLILFLTTMSHHVFQLGGGVAGLIKHVQLGLWLSHGTARAGV